MRRTWTILAVALTACGGAQGDDDFVLDHVPWERDRVASSGPVYHANSYHLHWQGKRIGSAREVFHRSDTGIRIIRSERIEIMRGGVRVPTESEITIEADLDLRARRVELAARAGAVERTGHAIRADDGSWILALDGETNRRISEAAIPIELVPFLAARGHTFETRTPVFLAGYGFASAHLRLERDGQLGRVILETPWGELETQLRLDEHGALVRAEAGSTSALRVDPERLDEPFSPPDLPRSSAIAIRGRGATLVLEHIEHPPPAILGQTISMTGDAWRIGFERSSHGPDPVLQSIADEVQKLLGPAHDAPGAGAKTALALGRGDCTAHAALFVDLASERGLQAQLVTGYRIDDGRLVRHRWAAVRRGDDWISVDPTFGEAPARPGRLVALAMHGGTTAELALVDEVVFAGYVAAKARWDEHAVSVSNRRR